MCRWLVQGLERERGVERGELGRRLWRVCLLLLVVGSLGNKEGECRVGRKRRRARNESLLLDLADARTKRNEEMPEWRLGSGIAFTATSFRSWNHIASKH
jgi:hypothetical protein